MKTAIVTGATSFVGHALVKHLLGQGVEVHGVVRPGSPNTSVLQDCPGAHIVCLDLQDLDRLPQCIPQGDIFFHLGWDGSGAQNRAIEEIQQENVTHALKAVQAAHHLGCKTFLFTGSQAEYGPIDGIIREDTPCHPVTAYGRAKLEAGNKAGELVRSLGMRYIHSRIFSIYGPGDHPWTLVSQCVSQFLKGAEIALSSCEQTWNYLYVTDAARFIASLGETEEASGIYNIAGTDTRALHSFVEEIHTLCGSSGTPLYAARTQSTERPYSLMPDVTRLLGATGLTPRVSFQEGIKSMLPLK